MSLRDYKIAHEINRERGFDWVEDFYALVMVLMLNADGANQTHLRAAWPHIWDELQARWNSPQGLLVGERNEEGWSRTEEGLFDPDGKLVRAI